MKHMFVMTLVLAFIPSVSLAKRSPPPKVKPVVHDGVRYIAPNSDGENAHIQAWDAKSGKVLWQKKIFNVKVNPRLETDVQHVYIKSLKVQKGKLIIIAERNRRYSLDLKTRKVKALKEKKKP